MALVQQKNKPVSEVCQLFETVPQLLTNVRYESGEPLEDERVKKAIAAGEEKNGRQRTFGHPSFWHRAAYSRDG